MKVRTALMVVSALSLAPGAMCQERPKVTGISHLAVYTTDPAKAESFYVHDLGAFKGLDPENSAGVRYSFSATQFVEVLPLPAGSASVNRLDHAAFNTSDADAMRKYLQAHGVEVPSSVTKAGDGSEYFEVKDPEGNKVQL
ncbi:MAG TPA: VOC family protein, partial [Candidatus Sulfotelmatobacter sp.]|nr:VOC family protein [Candidatus Sulfotelmatobacter sp.]